MNEVFAPHLVTWSRRRWSWTIVVALGFHVALVFWFSDRSQGPRHAPPAAADAWLVLDAPAQDRLARDLAPVDPTLFALPHPRNFSGSSWLNLPKMTDDLHDWTDKEPLSAIHPPAFAANRGSSIQPPPMTYPPIASKPEPRWLETLLPEEPFSTGSLATVEGDLQSRPVIRMPVWPAWPCTAEQLSKATVTVVQLWVDGEGFVRDASLWSESGVTEADRYAVREARQIRFQPERRSENPILTWGTLVVRWGTALPAGTNQARLSL